MHFRIRKYGDPILRTIGIPIVNFDDDLKKFADNLVETMHVTNAAGLAAQHVGYALQLCVIDVLESIKITGEELTILLDDKPVPLNLLMPLIIINPQFISVSSREIIADESSVSFPGGIRVPISRPESVHLKFQDTQGIWHELKCDGFLARCILHEYDQIHGILFIDKAQRRDLIRFEVKLKQLKRDSRDFLKKQNNC